MRSKLLLLFLSFLILPAGSYSGNEAHIRNIRKLYNITKKNIDSGHLYCNEFVLNRNKLPFPAVGNYQEIIGFYYASSQRRGVSELKMITLRGERSITRSHAEFLLNSKNELIFYYYRFNNGQGDTTESRCYFRDGKLVRLIDQGKIIDDADKKFGNYGDAIITKSKKLRSFFFAGNGFSLFDIENLKK